MHFTSLLLLLILPFLSLVFSAPTPAIRDVFSPPVTYPHKGTVWKVGKRYTVTWDMAGAPEHITNNIGMIVLVKDGRMVDLDHPLAKNFPINCSHYEITVPKVKAGHDYQILVFGDSGK
ncbi:hypothetical protein HMN09_00966000 [Mycena chlorophos]|uniref:Uncharacterized protein n=1 Tax=Mycena chlorophos TaxID=658473 RepID=A0A8H6SJ57_MYCCL|nr:hypothetical protein HMN09_00966000 [Mycena chlorophos]